MVQRHGKTVGDLPKRNQQTDHGKNIFGRSSMNHNLLLCHGFSVFFEARIGRHNAHQCNKGHGQFDGGLVEIAFDTFGSLAKVCRGTSGAQYSCTPGGTFVGEMGVVGRVGVRGVVHVPIQDSGWTAPIHRGGGGTAVGRGVVQDDGLTQCAVAIGVVGTGVKGVVAPWHFPVAGYAHDVVVRRVIVDTIATQDVFVIVVFAFGQRRKVGRGGWFAVNGWQVGERQEEEKEQGGGFAGGRGGGDGVVHLSQWRGVLSGG